MPSPWPDAAADDEQPFIAASPRDSRDQSRRKKPSWWKRISAISVLIVLLFPFAFLLWMTSWTASTHTGSNPSSSTASDSFVLDPHFDTNSTQTTRVYHWTVSAVPVAGNRTRTVVNGRSPGPIIQANVHDRILVYVTNGLKEEGTSIHWHGLPLPDAPFYDGTPGVSQCPIPPGATMLYNFTFGGWTGTTWWHGHTAMHHTDGLFGPLVVHAPDEGRVHNYTAEHVLTFSDVLLTPAGELLETYLNSHDMETVPEPVPDSVTINGRGGGAHPDAETQHGARGASETHTARRRQETHGVEDNPGYPNPPSATGGADEGYFEVGVEPGTTTRLRLIHAGTFAPLRVSIDGHALTIIEADGSAVAPVLVRDLVLQPAQRYSVLVTPEDKGWMGAFWIRARMVEDKFSYENPTMQPEARAILWYGPASTSSTTTIPLPTTQIGPPLHMDSAEWNALPHFDEWALQPAVNSNSAAPPNAGVLTIPFIFSIQRTHELSWRSFINGTSWEIPPRGEAALVRDTAGVYAVGERAEAGVKIWPGDQLIATLTFNQTVDFVITNLDDGDHPFHLHGYAPWLLGTGRGRYKVANAHLDTSNPLRRDTFTVPSRGWAVVRIVADNPGYWAFHCHIAWHMMGGGLFQIAVPPVSHDAGFVLPADAVEQCKAWGV
ncbi:multi-copper oxidase [Mycena albidolilacea]|uniref:Multi-copper oxidase n=1 Tax=Mycena albidolilacea TaxID=1033008 RepID=A0AAD7AB98_9AGAR|nr:multi-copper oxidase [Mycena albidolilacea]